MNSNFIRARALALAVSALMAGVVSADAYEQATPSLPPVTGPGGSKIIPPTPPGPPPAPQPSMQGSDMTMPQDGMQQPGMQQPGMQQPGMDQNMQMQQNGNMNGQPPGGMGGQPPGMKPPGMSGGRSNAPMPPPPGGGMQQQGGGTMAPPPPQSKRTPIVKSKTQASKKR